MKVLQLSLIIIGVAMLTGCNKTPDLKFANIEFINADGEVEVVKIGEGKKTVVHFFASWCGDCRREMPDANRMLSGAPDDVRVYYLTDESGDKKKFMEEKYQIPFPTYTLKESLRANGIVYIPLNYFIDEDGQQVIAQAEKIDWDSKEIKTFLGYE